MSFELYNVELFTELLPGIVWMADLIDFWSSIPIKWFENGNDKFLICRSSTYMH